MTAYHRAAPHGLFPPGFHDGPADQCDNPACHAQPAPDDPAADIELMGFDLATGSELVTPGALKAAIAALDAKSRAQGRREAAAWLTAEYPGPSADVAIRRAAARLINDRP
jgi:hypothetical protein